MMMIGCRHMKINKQENLQRGILGFARSYSLFGIKFFWLGVFLGILRERRCAEVIHSICCEFLFQLRPVRFPESPTKQLQVNCVFLKFETPNGNFLSRKECVIRCGQISIACEYGQPGSRILVTDGNHVRIFAPYADDPLVWHIHAICHVADDRYIVTTGDSRKYADLMTINMDGCRIVRRLYHRLGGFTALVNINGHIWAGSDLSERVNYIRNITTSKTYFLPERAFGAYVVNIVQEDGKLSIVTKKLNCDSGYVFTFDLAMQHFTAGNKIIINEKVVNAAIHD